MKSLRNRKRFRAEQLREFTITLDDVLHNLRDINQLDRAELQRETGLKFAAVIRRTQSLKAAARSLEKRLRKELDGGIGTAA